MAKLDDVVGISTCIEMITLEVFITCMNESLSTEVTKLSHH